MRAPDLSPEEMAQFRDWVSLLTDDDVGNWSLTSLAHAIGYSGPSALSTVLKDTTKGVSTEKYDAVRFIFTEELTPDEVEEGEFPALRKASASQKTRRTDMVTKEDDPQDFRRFEQIFDILKHKFDNVEDLAQKIGYKHAQSLYQAMRRGRIPREVFDNLMNLPQEEGARKRLLESEPRFGEKVVLETAAQAAPRTRGRTALDFFKVSNEFLQRSRRELEAGLTGDTFNDLLKPGVERVIRKMREIEDTLESVA